MNLPKLPCTPSFQWPSWLCCCCTKPNCPLSLRWPSLWHPLWHPLAWAPWCGGSGWSWRELFRQSLAAIQGPFIGPPMWVEWPKALKTWHLEAVPVCTCPLSKVPLYLPPKSYPSFLQTKYWVLQQKVDCLPAQSPLMLPSLSKSSSLFVLWTSFLTTSITFPSAATILLPFSRSWSQ